MMSTANATSVLNNTMLYIFINILCALTIMNSLIKFQLPVFFVPDHFHTKTGNTLRPEDSKVVRPDRH